MIIPMKKAQIVVLKDDREKLLKSLQRYGELMIITDEENSNLDNKVDNALSQRTEKTLKLMKKYSEKKGLFGDFTEVTYNEFINENPDRIMMLEKIETIEQKIINLSNQNEVIKQEIMFLLPWEDLDFAVSDSKFLKYASIHTVFVERKNIESISNVLLSYDLPFNVLGYSSESGQALVFACLKNNNEEIFEKLNLIGFSEIKLDTDNRLVKDVIQEKKILLQNNEEAIKSYQDDLKNESNNIKELEILNDQINSINELNKVNSKQTLATTYLEGWVRSDRLDRLEMSIKEATDIYDLAIVDPQEGEVPPTVTKNNSLVTPFETITDMFSRPNQGDIDPNPLMSFWYWIIFGLMMADAGYGVLMIILFGALIKLTKPKGEALKLYKVLLYSGVTTIFWGVLFGSYFGVTWKPILFVPMDEPLKMLIFSLVFGAIHVLSGVVANAYKNFKNHNYLDIIYDQLSWILVIVGLGLLFLPKFSTVGIVLALIGALIVLCTAGRAKKNLFGKIAGGFTGLYGATGYMSDILSYSRLLALGMSTAVVSYVMNLMAEMLQGNAIGFFFSIFVYIIGHGFNLVMGLLSAYVHDSRLQYIEFFGKFYEGGGYSFEPLSLKLKYVDKVIDKNNIN